MSLNMEELGDFFDLDESLDLSEELDSSELDREWQFLKTSQLPDFSLAKDPVDVELLTDAKSEFHSVCSNARQLLNVNDNESITLSDCANYFLESIIVNIFDAVKKRLPANETPSGADIATFIRVLAYLSVYSTTPTNFFDPTNADLFPVVQHCKTAPSRKS